MSRCSRRARSPACWWRAPRRRGCSAARTSRCCGSPPSAWASPSRTRACTSASTRSRRRFSAACCPTTCRRSPGLEVAARYLPAASEAEVGGDWYDVIPMAGGAVGLVMGDVAGKGLAGASMVGRLRSALRAYALEGHDGARVVEQLNRLLWTEAEDSQMATMLYVIVDPAASSVRWVNAGHPAPLMVVDGEPALPRGRGIGAARGPAVPHLRGGLGADDPRQHAAALHRRSRRATGREHRRRHGGARRARARGARGPRRPLRPPARDPGARRRGHGRRGDPDPAQPSGARALQRRVPGASPSRSRRCAPCCAAGSATPGRERWRSRRSPPPAARRPPTRSSTEAPAAAPASRCRAAETGARSSSRCAITAHGARSVRATTAAAST